MMMLWGSLKNKFSQHHTGTLHQHINFLKIFLSSTLALVISQPNAKMELKIQKKPYEKRNVDDIIRSFIALVSHRNFLFVWWLHKDSTTYFCFFYSRLMAGFHLPSFRTSFSGCIVVFYAFSLHRYLLRLSV